MRMVPAGLQRMRSRLALRQRFRNPVTVKNDAQRRWWLEQWDPGAPARRPQSERRGSLLGDAEIAPTYLGRRRSSPAERGTKVQLLAALCFSIRVRAITDQIRRCALPRGPRPR